MRTHLTEARITPGLCRFVFLCFKISRCYNKVQIIGVLEHEGTTPSLYMPFQSVLILGKTLWKIEYELNNWKSTVKVPYCLTSRTLKEPWSAGSFLNQLCSWPSYERENPSISMQSFPFVPQLNFPELSQPSHEQTNRVNTTSLSYAKVTRGTKPWDTQVKNVVCRE